MKDKKEEIKVISLERFNQPDFQYMTEDTRYTFCITDGELHISVDNDDDEGLS